MGRGVFGACLAELGEAMICNGQSKYGDREIFDARRLSEFQGDDAKATGLVAAAMPDDVVPSCLWTKKLWRPARRGRLWFIASNVRG